MVNYAPFFVRLILSFTETRMFKFVIFFWIFAHPVDKRRPQEPRNVDTADWMLAHRLRRWSSIEAALNRLCRVGWTLVHLQPKFLTMAKQWPGSLVSLSGWNLLVIGSPSWSRSCYWDQVPVIMQSLWHRRGVCDNLQNDTYAPVIQKENVIVLPSMHSCKISKFEILLFFIIYVARQTYTLSHLLSM